MSLTRLLLNKLVFWVPTQRQHLIDNRSLSKYLQAAVKTNDKITAKLMTFGYLENTEVPSKSKHDCQFSK